MKTQIISVSNREPTEWYYHMGAFRKSCEKLGDSPLILGLGEPWRGLMTKPNTFRNYLRGLSGSPQDRLILTDCWDVVFTKTADEVSNRCRELFGDAIVFNTEKACWPHPELAIHFPDMGTPWRYLNGGVMCGPAGNLLAMFESMKLEEIGFDRKNPDGTKTEPNDATVLVNAFVAQPVPIAVDAKCEVFQCFSGCTADEFEISSTGVRNKQANTTPGILHFNGASKNDIFPIVRAAMGL